MRAIRVVVRGHVQGVGFRYATHGAATRLGLAGWVRNLADGAVEVWAQGDDGAIDQLIDFLHDGPSAARVDAVRVEEGDPDPSQRRFWIT